MRASQEHPRKRLPSKILARIQAAPLSVQKLVFDVLISMGEKDRTTSADTAAMRGRSKSAPNGMDVQELEAISEYLSEHFPGTPPGRTYRADADAVAYSLGVLAGQTTADIARFFGVEYEYAKLRIRRLREQAIRSKLGPRRRDEIGAQMVFEFVLRVIS